MTKITRFAPSPTGALHIGGVRTALFNYVYAKQNNIIKAILYWKTAQKLGAESDLLDKKIKNEAFFE